MHRKCETRSLKSRPRSMGKRSDFKRRPQDAYDTPAEAVVSLLPHLELECRCVTTFWEPCAGSYRLAAALEEMGPLQSSRASDIEPRHPHVDQADALTVEAPIVDWIITNPPWTRSILHLMIERFSDMRPTWLLFDADWVHTKQSIPFMPRLQKVVSVGRVSWMENGATGKDNCAWHLFDARHEGPTELVGRAA